MLWSKLNYTGQRIDIGMNRLPRKPGHNINVNILESRASRCIVACHKLVKIMNSSQFL